MAVFRFALTAIVLSGSLLALALAGCKSIGGSAPAGQAQVRVSGHVQAEIEAKAEEVFFRYGFDFRGAADGRMEFERRGGTLENVLYGNWTEKDTRTRVTLYITAVDGETYDLRTRSMVIRDSFGGDEDSKNFDVAGGRYRVILGKIKNELQ